MIAEITSEKVKYGHKRENINFFVGIFPSSYVLHNIWEPGGGGGKAKKKQP